MNAKLTPDGRPGLEADYADEAVQCALDQGHAAAAGLNALVASLDAAGRRAACADAAASGRSPERPLAGVPFVVKDNIASGRFPCTAASPVLAGQPVAAPAGVVTRLEAAGAVVVGTANMHELAFGVTSVNPHTGNVANPYDAARFAGGSSGGSAAAVATGAVPFALGTDTGGSARIPPSLCGIAGLRPTLGRYELSGLQLLSSTRDVIGPMARSVAEVRTVDWILAGRGIGPPPPRLHDLDGVRIGVARTPCCEDLDAGVAALFEQALADLGDLGATLIDVDAAEVVALDQDCGFAIALFEARVQGERIAAEAGLPSYAAFIAAIGSDDVRQLFASQAGADAVPEQVYRTACRETRPRLQAAYQRLFGAQRIAALAMPTTPVRALPMGEALVTRHNGVEQPVFPLLVRNVSPNSAAGLPGISVPMGLADGLPAGLELQAPVGADDELLEIAGCYDAARPRPRPVPTGR